MTARPVTDVDLLDPMLHASGAIEDVFRELRAVSPVVWCRGRRGPGYWSVVGHPELAVAARDAASWSSYWGTRPEVIRPAHSRRPLHNLDPPEHGALRAIAARAFDAEQLDALDPAITAIVDDELGALLRAGGGDAVALGGAIASRVFAAWLGLPDPDGTDVLAYVLDVHAAGAALLDTAADDPGRPARVARARAATEAIARRMADALASASHDRALGVVARGARGHDEALGLATLFVEAGMPTLIDALASAVVDLLATGTAIVPANVATLTEELLRRASPIAQFARRATRTLELAGQTIGEGQQLVLWFVSANHDERVFVDPDALVPARSPNPHVAFGIGPHRCLGAALARRVLRVLCLALERHRHALVPGHCERRASSYLRGYARAPLRASGA